MSNEDPLLVGLTGEKKGSAESQRSGNVDELDLDTAARFVKNMKTSSAPAEPASSDEPRLVSADVAPIDDTVADTMPPGAITAANGKPFTDFDSASYKAQQMQSQTGDAFFVCALSATRFVVLGQSQSSKSRPRDHVDDDEQEVDPAIAYRDIPINELKLEHFPKDHPVHTCGLNRYKKYMKKNFKFKPAYRSMWPLLLVIGVGAFVYLFPVITISQLPQDVINNILTSLSPEQFTMGVSYTGAALAIFAAIKVMIQRISHRYMLMPAFAKYEYGIIKRESSKIAYSNISNYEVRQSVLGRLLNYGDMELASPGTNDSEIKMNSILAPRLVEVVLEGKIDEARRCR